MNPYEDTPYFQVLRHNLVLSLRDKGITDPHVLDAIYSIPRQFFMKPQLQSEAYTDRAFPIGQGQTISQPYTVAYQTQLLRVRPTDKILEIGTGSAYQACVLAAMGAEVFTIERQKKLFDLNKGFGYLRTFRNIHFFYGDGYEGLPQFAPFDKVLITAATPHIPPKLIDQMKYEGLMVLPLGGEVVQRMARITKLYEGELREEYFDKFSFVPMLKGRKE